MDFVHQTFPRVEGAVWARDYNRMPKVLSYMHNNKRLSHTHAARQLCTFFACDNLIIAIPLCQAYRAREARPSLPRAGNPMLGKGVVWSTRLGDHPGNLDAYPWLPS